MTAPLSCPLPRMRRRKSGVSDVANFLDLPAEGVPGLIDSRAVLGASVGAPIDGPFQGRPHRHDLCAASEKCIECRTIPSIEGVCCLTQQLDFLDRHRPPSISRFSENRRFSSKAAMSRG